LLILLERRLDNVTYRLGFASSRAEARTMVSTRDLLINGKKSTFIVHRSSGDVVSVKEPSRQLVRVQSPWKAPSGEVFPTGPRSIARLRAEIKYCDAGDVTMPINENNRRIVFEVRSNLGDAMSTMYKHWTI